MGADGPSGPVPRLVSVRIMSAPLQGQIVVAFLGPYYGAIVHQTARESFPCLEGLCPKDWHNKRTVWKGFTPAEAWDEHAQRWHPVCFEVTEHLEEQLRGRRLRGEVWSIERAATRSRTSAVCGTYLETLAGKDLSPTFDVRIVVCRRYHVHDIPPPVPNPVIPRLAVAAPDRPAPALPGHVDPVASAEAAEAERLKVRELLNRGRSRFGMPAKPDSVDVDQVEDLRDSRNGNTNGKHNSHNGERT